MTRIVKNRDNSDLLPSESGDVDIGYLYVKEVNGSGAEEIPDFVPTRHELLQLLTFWSNVHFNESNSGRTTDQLMYFSSRRMDRLADLLDIEDVKRIVVDVFIELGKKRAKQR